LRPHAENARIYGDHADADLVESVRMHGILNPLLVTRDGQIISGHRRADAAQKAGLRQVPAVVFESADDLDILEALIESNRQRSRTNEQIGREFGLTKWIYNERVSRQGVREDIHGTSGNQLTKVPTRPGRQAAEALGVSHVTANRAEAVVKVIDELKSNGKDREAGQLRTVLNGNVGKAYANAREAGWLQSRGSVEREQSRRYVTLKEWRVMDAPTRAAVLVAGDRGNTSLNAQDENSIEWALRSWNPVTGCLHNCSYCYARDIANRFYESKFAPVLWPDRLWAPSNVKVPAEASTQIAYKNVFTCSMADLFGRWVPTEWIEAVLDVVRDNHQWNFLFLTKFPGRLSEFRFPTNAWVGATVDAQARVPFVEKAFASVTASVKWLSCEPLLEPLQFERLDLFQWIVLGGASRSTETPDFRPPRRWITDLERQAIDAGCKVYEKTNLLERLRQYPGAQSTVDVDVPVEFKMGYLQRDLKDWQTYEREVTR
jgi:protein gp37